MHIQVLAPNPTRLLRACVKPDSSLPPAQGPAECRLGTVNDNLPRQAGLNINIPLPEKSIDSGGSEPWQGGDGFMMARVYLQCV